MGYGQQPSSPFRCTGVHAADAMVMAHVMCRQRGTRLTALRRAVLETRHNAGRPLGAYDLIPRLAKALGRRPTPQTVYRTLDFLREQGLVSRIESRSAYVPCTDPAGPDACVFFLCESCGVAMEVESPDLDEVIVRDAASLGFRIGKRVLELHGTCAQCLAPTAAPATGAL